MVYGTSFCNHGHRLVDGKPVNHKCFVLPKDVLQAERVGDYIKANEILSNWTVRKVHKGVKS